MNLASFPLVDNHCHSLLRAQPATGDDWRACFTESYFPEVARRDVAHTVFYQWATRQLAGFYGCEPDADAILEQRRAIDLASLTRRLNADAGVRAWLVDYGYLTGKTYSHDELAPIAGVAVRPILRLEPLIERLIGEAADFAALVDAYRAALHDLRGQGYVSLKSIIAYRSGLTIGDATPDAARAAFPALSARARREGGLRIDSKPMLDYLIPLALEIAAAQEFPVQIHTGFGDPDQDLAKGNPAFLRPLFDEKYRGAKIVLLHASYPYTRTLGYLASVYPNVYADFGLALPFVAGDARAVVRELLGLAPASKVLYSSDGFHIPELHWLGAKASRRALGAVLEEFVAEGLISAASADGLALRILYDNAVGIYELKGM